MTRRCDLGLPLHHGEVQGRDQLPRPQRGGQHTRRLHQRKLSWRLDNISLDEIPPELYIPPGLYSTRIIFRPDYIPPGFFPTKYIRSKMHIKDHNNDKSILEMYYYVTHFTIYYHQIMVWLDIRQISLADTRNPVRNP